MDFIHNRSESVYIPVSVPEADHVNGKFTCRLFYPVDFSSFCGYHIIKLSRIKKSRGCIARYERMISMKKSTGKLIVFLSVIISAVALIASLTTIFIYFDKKKDEEELERYLDDSIQ